MGVTDPTARAAAVEQELSRLAKQFEEGSFEEARVVAELEVSRREHSALEAEVARLDAALTQNLATLAVAEAAAAAAELAAVAARTEVVAAVERVAVATDKVREVALLSYVGQGELELAAVVLQDAKTAVELGVGMTYARVVGEVQQARIEQLRREEASLRQLEGAAADANKKAAATKAELQTVRFQLQADRASREAARQRVAAEVVVQQQLVVKAQAALAGFRARIASLQAESASIGALLRAQAAPPVTTAAPNQPVARAAPTTAAAAKAQPVTAPKSAAPAPAPAPKSPAPAPRPAPPVTTAAPAPPPGTAAPGTTAPPASARPTAPVGSPPPTRVSLSFPLPGFPIVSGFGMRVQPLLGIRRLHEGIDIWAPAGTPIHAAGDGTVLWAGPRNGYGIAVILDHGNGLGTVYAHQSAVAVAPGQRVGRGAVIGYVGQTGLAAGPHLHFEVRINGTAYDPLNFVHP